MIFFSLILYLMFACCYRSRYYLFEEHLGQWYEKLKTDEPTTMTVRLQKEIEKYKVNTGYSLSLNAVSCKIIFLPT